MRATFISTLVLSPTKHTNHLSKSWPYYVSSYLKWEMRVSALNEVASPSLSQSSPASIFILPIGNNDNKIKHGKLSIDNCPSLLVDRGARYEVIVAIKWVFEQIHPLKRMGPLVLAISSALHSSTYTNNLKITDAMGFSPMHKLKQEKQRKSLSSDMGIGVLLIEISRM